MLLTVNLDVDLSSIPVWDTPKIEGPNPFQQLMQLDSWIRPGIREGDFFMLFVKCDRCDLIMTRRVFEDHYCELKDCIIDLTLDDD
jgi:hypothetical protein